MSGCFLKHVVCMYMSEFAYVRLVKYIFRHSEPTDNEKYVTKNVTNK